MMKLFICAFFAAFIAALPLNGQDKASAIVEDSNVSRVNDSKYSIIKYEEFKKRKINTTGGTLSVIPVSKTDLKTGSQAFYIELEFISSAKDYRSVIGLDEVPSCIESFEYIMDSQISSKPSNRVYIEFSTRTVLFTFMYEKILGWSVSVAHLDYTSHPSELFSIQEFPAVIDAFKEYLDLLSRMKETSANN